MVRIKEAEDEIIEGFVHELYGEVVRYRAQRRRRRHPLFQITVRGIPVSFTQEIVETFDCMSDPARALILGLRTRMEEDDFRRDAEMLHEHAGTYAREDNEAVRKAIRMLSTISADDRCAFPNSGHGNDTTSDIRSYSR